jgi:predicted nucleotidyltransferase
MQPNDPGDVKPELNRFFARQPDVILAYLFGSYGTGQAWAKSDLDIGVLFDESISSSQRFKLALRYGAQIERTIQTGLEVDVRVLNTAPVEFLMQVIKPRQCLFARSEMDRIRFEARVTSTYCDFKPILDQYYSYMLERIKEGDLRYGLAFRRHLATLGYAAAADRTAD